MLIFYVHMYGIFHKKSSDFDLFMTKKKLQGKCVTICSKQ